MRPRFSIVVPTYNRPDHLRRCLTSLGRLGYPVSEFEVIVVDDGSPQPLDRIVAPFGSRLNLTLLRKAHGGPGAARNAGAALARGTYLAFTDDDCRPSKDWLDKLEGRLNRCPDHMIGGRTVNRLTRNPYSIASQTIVDLVYAYYNQAAEPRGFFTSNNMAIGTSLFDQLGGFESQFLEAASEDREICDRWLRSGHKLTYAPEAIVFHLHQMNLRGFCRQQFTYGRATVPYHRLRALRGAGPVTVDLPFHFQFLQRLRNPAPGSPSGRAAAVGLLLILSQVVYAAGFLFETGRQIADGLLGSPRTSPIKG